MINKTKVNLIKFEELDKSSNIFLKIVNLIWKKKYQFTKMIKLLIIIV